MTDAPVGLDRATAFLVQRFGSGVAGVEPIGFGEWSKAFAFRLDGSDLVVRFGRQRESFEKDRLAMAFAASDLPIPRISEIGEALGGWYAVSERAAGRFLDDLSGEELRSVLPSLFDALDEMRRADVSRSIGYGGWGADGDAPFDSWPAFLLDITVADDRPDGWRVALAGSSTGIGPFDEAAARLAELVRHCPAERRLIHSDLLHWNVLVDGGHISAVVDWQCAMYGDFLYDVAWLAFWAEWNPAWSGIDWPAEAERHYRTIGLAVPALAERMHAYRIHIGLDGLRYNAYMGRWDEVALVAERTLTVAREVCDWQAALGVRRA